MTDKKIYKNGVALLEEWEDVNYCEHNFKFKDEWLTDKEVVDLLSQLNDEIEHLKQRNKRQYNQLTDLWSLIEAEDWETLNIMVKQMKEEDERLQRIGA